MLYYAPMTKTAFLAILALQICLDRRGFSPNVLDGQAGNKTFAALAAYCSATGLPPPQAGDEQHAFLKYFPHETDLFMTLQVTKEDLAALTKIPESPAGKAALPAMGYETLQEMFAERGHVTQRTLARLNPHIVWTNATIGTKIRVPRVTADALNTEKAALVKVSLSDFAITALDANGRMLARFPCSIAKDKAKRPPPGEIRIITQIPAPNYTYTPDAHAKGTRPARHIFPPGPNNPVGTAWLGLSLPGYGIHGSPNPERIGRAESHGCFRLSNWNAERLYNLVKPGTRVLITP